MKTDICSLNKKQLLELNPEDIDFLLSKQEILHIFRELGALWLYNYGAAKKGKVGLHAELKSGRCSDGFLNAKVALVYKKICRLFAMQEVLRFKELFIDKPEYVVGIPSGATKLGEYVAEFLGVQLAEMVKKDNDTIEMITQAQIGQTIMFAEDFSTLGTGCREAIKSAIAKGWIVLPYLLTIINRGGLKFIKTLDYGSIEIVSVAEHRINDWNPEDCPLCKLGSKRIKPKASKKNWENIMNSQF